MRSSAATALLAILALSACGKVRQTASESSSAEARCTRCHGGAENETGAPPNALRGASDPSAMPVGAHTAHVQPGALAGAFACTACHPDPRSGSTHLDGTVELRLDGFAHDGLPGNGATPEFVEAAGTCSNVYCHGAFRNGNGGNTPVWNRVGEGQAACGSCHGAPPPPPHPGATDCGRCHAGYTASSVNVATHVNGNLDVVGLSCTSCHGDPSRAKNGAAPPLGTHGETATSERAVGAHQAHLEGAALGTPVACDACHTVPTSLVHATGTVELTFGALATVGGTFTATWDGATCATYCHGATLGAGGSNTAPRWTGGSGEAACGSCHAVPPPSPHPAVSGDLSGCSVCHPQTMAGGALIPASAGGKHLDGVVESSGHDAAWMDRSAAGFHAFSADADLASCTTCHGERLDGGSVQVACARCHGLNLPSGVSSWLQNCVMCHGGIDNASGAPPRTIWGRSGDAVRVGAHTAHVSGSAIAAPFDCSECHVKPADALSPGHVDGTTATVKFGDIGAAGLIVPPVWDRGSGACSNTYCHGAFSGGNDGNVPLWTGGAGEAGCGTCHGLPPPSPHPSNTDCSRCHPGYTATSVNVATHVNGHNDVSGLTCASCHGDPTRGSNAAAPPIGTHGETSTTERAVGAHQAHLGGSVLGTPIACTECHQVPTSLVHANGVVELRFGSLATHDGTFTAAWNGTTCATYCHGATLGAGGSNVAPRWTGGSAEATCGSCHAVPPPSPHPSTGDRTTCRGCHPDTMDSAGNLIPASAGGKHLDGTIQVLGGHDTSWMNRDSPGFHAYSADAGLTSCQSCHGPALDAIPSGNCANARCHGGNLPSGVSNWWQNCTMCHGGAENQTGAPPKTIWGYGDDLVRVGAHTAHVTGGLSAPISCTLCHTVPADAFAPGHIDGPTATVQFSGLAAAGLSAPSWTRSSATCAATYCHRNYGGTFEYTIYDWDLEQVVPRSVEYAGRAATPSWTDASIGCGSCHWGGESPVQGRTWHGSHYYGGNQCEVCHPDAAGQPGAATITDPSLHVNGTIDLAPRFGSSCRYCH